MINLPVVRSANNFIRSLSFRGRLLGGIWVLFFFLVVLGIHGSSTGVTASWWAPEKPYTGYLFNVMPPPGLGSTRIDDEHAASSSYGRGQDNKMG